MTTYLALDQLASFAYMPLVLVDEDGLLVDGHEVGYRVLDASNTLLYPVAGYQAVTTGPGHDGTGRYHPYDPADVADFSPNTSPATPLAANTRYMLEWRYKILSTDAYTYMRVPFDVVGVGLGLPWMPYASSIDVYYAMGGTGTPTAFTSSQVAVLQLAQQLIEKMTGQIFRPLYQTLKWDGNDSDLALFAVPIIGVESMTINSGSSVEPTDNYKVYAGRQYLSDDRKNPKICLGQQSYSDDLFLRAGSAGSLRYLPGRRNQSVAAVWGHTEADGSVPAPIANAMVRLYLTNVDRMSIGGTTIPRGPVAEEQSDRHSIKYQTAQSSGFLLQDALYQDPVVQSILRAYRAPIAINAPSPNWTLI